MNTPRCLPSALNILATAVLLAPGSLLAQGGAGLDVTMRMVTDDEDLAGGLVQELQLPEAPAGVVNGGAAGGRGRSGDLRDQGRALGREISEQARGRREEQSLGRPGNALELPSPSRGRADPDRPGPDTGPGNRPRPAPGGRP